jgi:anti-anti-sigma factor
LIQQLWIFRWRKRNKQASPATAQPIPFSTGFLKLPAHFDVAAVGELNEFLKLAEGAQALRVDASDVRFIDSTGIGFLSRLEKERSARGGHIVFIGASKELRRALAFMRVEEFFSFAPDETVSSELVLSQQT